MAFRIETQSEFAYELRLFEECLSVPIDVAIRQLINESRCTAWIASGLSKVAAECGRRMVQEWAGTPGRLFTPLDYCGSNISEYLPVLLSYRGKNLDIQSAGQSIVNASIKQVLLITGYEQSAIRAYLENHAVQVHTISLPSHRKDKRFVAVLATWAMTALTLRLAQVVSGLEPETTNLREVANRAHEEAERDGTTVVREIRQVKDWLSRKWIILGGGPTTPALVAWETMCAESALMSVVTSDMKDYTHGRYLSAMREKDVGFIILTNAMDASLGRIMTTRLSEMFPVIEIASQKGPVFDLCKHLFVVPLVVSALARANGQNIASPPKPGITNKWRNWGKIASSRTRSDWRF